MDSLKDAKITSITLGCKLNFAETSSMVATMLKHGALLAGENEVADVCIINTCSVTEVADSKCRQAIARIVRKNPGSIVVVTGCYAQLCPERVAMMEGVDLVLGNEQKGLVVEKVAQRLSMMPEERALMRHEFSTSRTADIRSFVPSCSCGGRTRYFLKVQDGCDYYCTYCTIPFARGRSRNGSIASLVQQAREAAENGGKEIVITGVNIGDFGKSTGESFIELLRQLDKVDGIERYRISSIEPNLLTDEVIEFCARSNKFMPHFHIPLQSGSDEVLRLMHRRYDTDFFRKKVERVLEAMPDAYIGVDTIVGTRGETAELFEEACHFMQSLPVAEYHVFSYSERAGTKALQIPHQVRPEEKHERSQRIINMSEEKMQLYYNRYIGKVRPVLLEHSRNEHLMHGFTDNYIRVEVEVESAVALDNIIVSVLLGDWNDEHNALMGTIEKATE